MSFMVDSAMVDSLANKHTNCESLYGPLQITNLQHSEQQENHRDDLPCLQSLLLM